MGLPPQRPKRIDKDVVEGVPLMIWKSGRFSRIILRRKVSINLLTLYLWLDKSFVRGGVNSPDIPGVVCQALIICMT